MSRSNRRFPVGAEPEGTGTHFRVWAPKRRRVSVVEQSSGVKGEPHPLEPEGNGYHSGLVRSLGVGSLYSFQLDEEQTLYPDPASRFQPQGVHGPSQIIDGSAYRWRDATFRGVSPRQVIYELHLGTFTREGTYRAASEQFAELARIGITTLELMPVADFCGHFGWGYDGVDLWAPTRLYGTPDELRAMVEAAHAHGLAVILDVVYNHLGPTGNYLGAFSKHYFSDRYENEWGEPLNFDGAESGPVREFFVQNARYWIEEFHFDGLRLDATQSMFDASEPHVIAEITRAVRQAGKALNKTVFIVAENEPQRAQLVRSPADGGYGCDALWNDDFHHTARVAVTGRHEAYYSDYRGTAQELISAIKWGYLYQGQHYHWQKKPRGRPALDLKPDDFVTYLQNHDQVANSCNGERLHRTTSLAELRAMTALMLLAPPTPMLFQGQEFAASTPFLYFADCDPEQAAKINEGRREFLSQFPSIAQPEVSARLADASDPRTFEGCKLDFDDRTRNAPIYLLHQDLLRLRREDPVFSQASRGTFEAAVLSERALLLRFFGEPGDRLLLVNLAGDLELVPAPEPLLAPPEGWLWSTSWSSEDPRYGGRGEGRVFSKNGRWRLPARSAVVLVSGLEREAPEPREQPKRGSRK